MQKEQLYQGDLETASEGLIISDFETACIVWSNHVASMMHGYDRAEFIRLSPETFIHPSSHELFREYVRVIHLDGVYEILARNIRRDGSQFYVEWRGTNFTYQGRPCILSILRDVSKDIQLEQFFLQRKKTLHRQQAKLLEIYHTLASTLELKPGLILDQLRGLVEYNRAICFELKDSSLVSLAVRGQKQLKQAESFRIQLTQEAFTVMLKQHRPILIDDVWGADPMAQLLRSFLGDRATVLLKGMQSWMWVPLEVKERAIGCLGIAHAGRNHYTTHHAELAMSIANQAAITLTNAELLNHIQTITALQERQRLAQNLHDAVNQSLFSAGLIAEVLPRLWKRDQNEGRQSLENLRRLMRGAQAEMRALLAELRPSVLTETDLGDLLRQLITAFTGRTNIPVTFFLDGKGALPDDVQVAFYRICQEGLNNIAKHAAASQVEIRLKYETNLVEMRIRDDGSGFVPGHMPTPGHYGLDMLAERADAVGAKLSISSQPKHGTDVIIRWARVPNKEAT
jgi:PAS domain S-box-containing protein